MTMTGEAENGPGYLEPKGQKGRDEKETNKEDENVDSSEVDPGQALKDNLFGAIFGAAQQQTGTEWQENTDDLYGLNYEVVTETGERVEINLVSPQSELGREEGLKQAAVKNFSLCQLAESPERGPATVYILGGDRDHEGWQAGGNQFYAEGHLPEAGEVRLEEDELDELYDAISSLLRGKQGEKLEAAVTDPERQGYASAEELVESIGRQLETSYQQALNCNEP